MYLRYDQVVVRPKWFEFSKRRKEEISFITISASLYRCQQLGPTGVICHTTYIFTFKSSKNISRDSSDTRGDFPKQVQDMLWFLYGPSMTLLHFLSLFSTTHFLSPSTLLEHLFGHSGNITGFNIPSWTFVVPQMSTERQRQTV